MNVALLIGHGFSPSGPSSGHSSIIAEQPIGSSSAAQGVGCNHVEFQSQLIPAVGVDSASATCIGKRACAKPLQTFGPHSYSESMSTVLPKPRYRFFRYSLRTFFVAITTLAVLIGWWSQSALRQKEAVAFIVSNMGGCVWYDYPQDPSNFGAPPPIPEPFLSFFGVDFFYNVIGVGLHRVGNPASPTRESISNLAAFPHLQALVIERSDLTNEDLRVVGSCHRLQRLQILRKSAVTDEGIGYLSQLHQLQTLELHEIRIAEASSRVIARLPALNELDLVDAELPEDAFVQISSMKQFNKLSLAGSKGVTKDTLRQLSHLTTLSALELTATTRITDDGLPELARMKKLRTLRLNYTRVTIDGVSRLHALLPQCDITDTATSATGQ